MFGLLAKIIQLQISSVKEVCRAFVLPLMLGSLRKQFQWQGNVIFDATLRYDEYFHHYVAQWAKYSPCISEMISTSLK